MKTYLIILFILMIGGQVIGQEHHHQTDTTSTKKQSLRKSKKNRETTEPSKRQAHTAEHAAMDTITPMDEHMDHDSMLMTHAYSRNLPMSRNGSGTAWAPDATPMYMYGYRKF